MVWIYLILNHSKLCYSLFYKKNATRKLVAFFDVMRRKGLHDMSHLNLACAIGIETLMYEPVLGVSLFNLFQC
ncbi:MAG: hypothetical protein A2X13_09175 [Bacteroidetes bacterium GWC2_33_15]|nr:MAG: hypothetical protein A2X10_01805 [Bacteroidetes bacterium GWA2_33_15]OFX49119.1 MAG: hypothetical protein A2X13_09175 [Bacteroidetes bacterium GWC2_33_15]OFX64887.1 MAG: hypothetical protein A2X15_06050 [Bacteroidetes bacterium GWB2_32_14]OFX68595.1 MAG: hypothetical protein A2X14_14615 [Bacteroidetes bacterium GWD2_33_33]HAN17444.1 hypothetical protein [Bacteroidales bacterium]